MRIEKVSDNQIRCTLTGEDLAKRQLKISELAYGSDKARQLFRDMMQEASLQFGFDAENIPLMIEAIPLNSECIVLIVTKVEDPEELDTRFSSFSPAIQNEAGGTAESIGSTLEQLIMNAIRMGQENASAEDRTSGGDAPQEADEAHAQGREQGQRRMGAGYDREAGVVDFELNPFYKYTHRLFVFDSLSQAADAALLVKDAFRGHSALYASEDNYYYLVTVFKEVEEVGAMQNVLAVLSEYGEVQPMSVAREQYLKEHCRVISAENAIETLSCIS